MIWRLTYCNKEGIEARLDIIKGASTPVEVIEGTATPFILNYKMDKSDKSGHVMSSSADISIFETPTFNIDNLKTSSETEIKVEYYINGVLDWSGFVIPDFFSKTIGTPATVEMVASDRLGTLKGVTLEDLNQYESMRDLAVKCLAKTGLTLPLYTMADFGNNGTTNAFFKALGLSGRLSDTKGRNISCYDILKSILVASNSKLVQQSGAWYIVNKWQHEQGVGNLFSTLTASTAYSEQTVSFSDVHAGARRTIIPVAATTGVFHEFGGGKEHPENFDFSMGVSGWTNVNGFTATTRSEEVVGYELIGGVYQPIYGGYTSINHLVNLNPAPLSGPTSPRYIKSADIPSPIEGAGSLKITASINATAYKAYPNMPVYVWYTVIAKKDGEVLALDLSGAFVPYVENQSVLERVLHKLSFKPGFTTVDFKAEVDTNSDIITGELAADELSDYTFEVRIYGSGSGSITLINFFSLNISSIKEQPRGSIFKRIQGTGFTKEHDIDTAIFGDYISRGLNGYFYTYAVDDTSSLYSSAGTLTEPLWTAHGDSEELPLLRHVTRQKSRMFSLAHNMISARIDVATFKPLNIFVDCNAVNPRHVVVSATYDFLRSEVEVELEQIAYATLDVREFIYSYFGEGESGISSVGGISGGGTGGGGMTSEQLAILNNLASWWKLDEENDAIYSEKSIYSLKGVSALGYGDGGGSGGGVDMLDSWANYTEAKADYYAPASLLVPFRSDTLSRLTSLENGSATSIATTGSGNAITSVSKSGNTLTFAKGSTFSLSTHNHDTVYKPIGYVPSWSEITGKPSTFAPSSHTHTIANVTGLQSALDGKQPTISTGTTSQYYRGDKTWQTLNTSVVPEGNNLYFTNARVKDYGDTLYSPLGHTHTIAQITGLQGVLDLKAPLSNPTFTGNVIAPTFTGALTGNASSATKLQTARTIAGVSFDGSANIAIPFANLSSKPTTLAGYGITDGALKSLTLTAGNGLTGGGTLEANRTFALGTPSTLTAASTNAVTSTSHTHAITTTTVGAANTIVATDASGGVRGDIIRIGANWTLELSGTELVFKYNGVIKQRMLTDGTILATGGITALATN